MVYDEDDWLPLGGLQHYAYCRRQWALITLENQWAENLRTTEGHLLHERAHDQEVTETRGDLVVTRGMPVRSRRLGVSILSDARNTGRRRLFSPHQIIRSAQLKLATLKTGSVSLQWKRSDTLSRMEMIQHKDISLKRKKAN